MTSFDAAAPERNKAIGSNRDSAGASQTTLLLALIGNRSAAPVHLRCDWDRPTTVWLSELFVSARAPESWRNSHAGF
jgi:hypothetical protein